MSRHKIVKNLDLDDELDDYDGGEDYAEEEGVDGGFLFSFFQFLSISSGRRPEGSLRWAGCRTRGLFVFLSRERI